jgi:histidinol-phosphate aminotransferase
MTAKLSYIRRHIQEMRPYEPILPYDVLSSELGIPPERLIKLDANENPFGPIPEVKAALVNSNAFHIYPDPESRRIRRLLAEHHDVRESSIVVGAGADELIDLIMRIVVEPGDKVINCPPTFGMYSFDSALNQAELVSLPRRADFSLDMPRILRAVDEQMPRLIFLANPNNPDGGTISESEFQQLVNLPLLLVMDEAYIQFIERGASVLKYVESFNNLIVLRTFSKWAGLAGLRIGYGVFPGEFVPMLMRAKQPYNVSVAAEQAAVITMQNLSKAQENIDRIINNRQHLFQALTKFAWLKPFPSQANFILCRVEGRSAFEVKQHLRKQGILIRYFDKPGLSDHIRISVGTKDQIEKLIAALKGVE